MEKLWRARQKLTNCLREQMQPGLPIVQCPRFQLSSQLPQLESSKKVRKLWDRGWYAAGNFVAPDSGQQNPRSRRLDEAREMFGRSVCIPTAAGHDLEGITVNYRI